ncbi:MAG: glycosyltransferase family 39 protein [Nanoarchaeota archaeon]
MAKKAHEQNDVSQYLKRNWALIALAIIFFIGLQIRTSHLNYPVNGYHNWKETHYLTEARNFEQHGFFTHGFFMPYWQMPNYEGNPSGVHGDTFPTISIIGGITFKLFGEHVWIVRLIGTLFNLGAILYAFLLMRALFKRDDLALLVAALLTFTSVLVFYSHNVQLINPALFFMMMSLYHFAVWRQNDRSKHLLLAVGAFSLGLATQYSFYIFAFPILLAFPYKKLLEVKKRWKILAIAVVILLFTPLWIMYSEANGGANTVINNQVQLEPKLLFDTAWQTAIQGYMSENYGVWHGIYVFPLLFVIGSALFAVKAIMKFDRFEYRLLLGYIIGAPIWIITMAVKMQGHNYHQYALVPLIMIMSGYLVYTIASTVGTLVAGFLQKNQRAIARTTVTLALIILFVWFTYSINKPSWNAQFDTRFVGLEIAGAYVKAHAAPGDQSLFPREQSFGFVWESGIWGTGNYMDQRLDLEKLHVLEDERNLQWIFAYQWGMNLLQNQEALPYLREHYSLAQIAFVNAQTPDGQQNVPIYFLFRRGGTFDENKINEYAAGKPVKSKTYTYASRDPIVVNYIDII